MDAKEKEQIIKSRQDYEKAEIKVINKDFYGDLPSQVCTVLDGISWHWRKYDWFEEAWNKYRDHVLSSVSNGNPIKTPGFIFNSYIDEQVAADFDKEFAERYPNERGMCECMHSDENLDDFLAHAKMDATGKNVIEHKWRVSNDCPDVKRRGEYCSEDDPYAEWITDSQALKEENAKAKTMLEYNKNMKALNNLEANERYEKAETILNAGKSITNDLSNIVQEHKGSIRINPKETKIKDNRLYKDISDEELNKRVRRMQLERQYGDLTGDAKYIASGKEKTREYLQTIGAGLGIILSIIAIKKAVKEK